MESVETVETVETVEVVEVVEVVADFVLQWHLRLHQLSRGEGSEVHPRYFSQW